jgi:hypothetical protein
MPSCVVCGLPTTTTCPYCDIPLDHDKDGCLRVHYRLHPEGLEAMGPIPTRRGLLYSDLRR